MAATAANFYFGSERFKQLLPTSNPDIFYKAPSQLAFTFTKCLSLQEKNFKIGFQGGGNLGFPIVMILAILKLQVVLILPVKFRVSWPFGSEVQN